MPAQRVGHARHSSEGRRGRSAGLAGQIFDDRADRRPIDRRGVEATADGDLPRLAGLDVVRARRCDRCTGASSCGRRRSCRRSASRGRCSLIEALAFGKRSAGTGRESCRGRRVSGRRFRADLDRRRERERSPTSHAGMGTAPQSPRLREPWQAQAEQPGASGFEDLPASDAVTSGTRGATDAEHSESPPGLEIDRNQPQMNTDKHG